MEMNDTKHVTLDNTEILSLLDRLQRREEAFGKCLEDCKIYDVYSNYIYLKDLKSEVISGKPLRAFTFTKIARYVVTWLLTVGQGSYGYSVYWNNGGFLDPDHPYEILPQASYTLTPTVTTTEGEGQQNFNDHGYNPDSGTSTTTIQQGESYEMRRSFVLCLHKISENAKFQALLTELVKFAPKNKAQNFLQGYPLQDFLRTANALLDMCTVFAMDGNLIGKNYQTSESADVTSETKNFDIVYQSSWYYDTYVGQTEAVDDWPELAMCDGYPLQAFGNCGVTGILAGNFSCLTQSYRFSAEGKVSAHLSSYPLNEKIETSFYWQVQQTISRNKNQLEVTHLVPSGTSPALNRYLMKCQGLIEICEYELQGNSTLCTESYTLHDETPLFQQHFTSQTVTQDHADSDYGRLLTSSIREVSLNPETWELSQPITFPFPADPPPPTIPASYFGGYTAYVPGTVIYANGTIASAYKSIEKEWQTSPLGIILTFGNGW